MATTANTDLMLFWATGDVAIEALVPADDLAPWWDIADARLDASAWGNERDNAVALMALHFLTANILRGGDGSVGPVTHERVGEWERRYAISGTLLSDPFLTTTKYGAMYLDIRGSRAARLPRVFL